MHSHASKKKSQHGSPLGYLTGPHNSPSLAQQDCGPHPTSSIMALTRTDFLDSLQTFKTELRTELRQDLDI